MAASSGEAMQQILIRVLTKEKLQNVNGETGENHGKVISLCAKKT
jgi:hypothetical protein